MRLVSLALAALIALVIMARINLTITLVVFLPLIGVTFFTRWAWKHILYYRKARAQASDAVSGFLGEAFGAVQALKRVDLALWPAEVVALAGDLVGSLFPRVLRGRP